MAAPEPSRCDAKGRASLSRAFRQSGPVSRANSPVSSHLCPLVLWGQRKLGDRGLGNPERAPPSPVQGEPAGCLLIPPRNWAPRHTSGVSSEPSTPPLASPMRCQGLRGPTVAATGHQGAAQTRPGCQAPWKPEPSQPTRWAGFKSSSPAVLPPPRTQATAGPLLSTPLGDTSAIGSCPRLPTQLPLFARSWAGCGVEQRAGN